MIARAALWIALRIVGAVARLVPGTNRAEWQREWTAELQHHAIRLQRWPARPWRSNMAP